MALPLASGRGGFLAAAAFGLCQRPDHRQLLTKPDNTRRRHQRS
jgi:hypothetical protein